MLIDLCLGIFSFFIFFLKKIGLNWAATKYAQKWFDSWTRPAETRQAGFGAKKKTCLLNEPGLGNKGGLTDRVRVSKNLTQT